MIGNHAVGCGKRLAGWARAARALFGICLVVLCGLVASPAMAQGGGPYYVELYHSIEARFTLAGQPAWAPYALPGETLNYEVHSVVSDWEKNYDTVAYLYPVWSFALEITLPIGLTHPGGTANRYEFDPVNGVVGTSSKWGSPTISVLPDGRQRLRFLYSASPDLIGPGEQTKYGLGFKVQVGSDVPLGTRLVTELNIVDIELRMGSAGVVGTDYVPSNNKIYRMTIVSDVHSDAIFVNRFEPVDNFQITDATRHGRCMNCHIVQRYPQMFVDAGAGSSHQHSVTTDNRNCAGCHSGIRPDWHAPIGMNFGRYVSDDTGTRVQAHARPTLCAMLKTHPPGHPVAGQPPAPGSLKTAEQHLTTDELLLWAFGDTQVPNGPVPAAPPEDRERWLEAVRTWFSEGAPCG